MPFIPRAAARDRLRERIRRNQPIVGSLAGLLPYGDANAVVQDMAGEVLAHTSGIAGFFGASSIERLAAGSGIEAQAPRFRDMRTPLAAPTPRAAKGRSAAPKTRAGAARTGSSRKAAK